MNEKSKLPRCSGDVDIATKRRAEAAASTMAGVKCSSAYLYARKWSQFRAFCMDSKLQEGNGVLDPDGEKEPSGDVVGKIVEYFYYKVVEKGCDPGEVVNIRSSLASVYKRRFHRIGAWKVSDDGKTEGSPVNSLLVMESMRMYQRQKKVVGFKRALPFRFSYMVKLCNYTNEMEDNILYKTYVMAATSLCFCLWLRIDELVKLTLNDVCSDEKNEEGVPYIMISLKDRKYTREVGGQSYALYPLPDEKSACAYTHLQRWLEVYKAMLNRQFMPSDFLFPHSNDTVTKLFFGEKMIPTTFMKTINSATSMSAIMPVNAAGEDLGRFTAHCFRRGGAQHRFVTGKSRWPLDVVKWWGGWGASDDFNTIIRYLLEETSRYERNFTHYLFTKGSDARMFNSNVSSLEDVGREIGTLQSTVLQKFCHFEQSSLANRLFISHQLENMARVIGREVNEGMKRVKADMMLELKLSKDKVAGPSDVDCAEREREEADGKEGDCKEGSGWTGVPSCRNWREVIVHWNLGCSEKNLMRPLKDWTSVERNGTVRSTYCDRKVIAEEYARLGEEAFVAEYSPDEIPMHELKSLIRSRNPSDA